LVVLNSKAPDEESGAFFRSVIASQVFWSKIGSSKWLFSVMSQIFHGTPAKIWTVVSRLQRRDLIEISRSHSPFFAGVVDSFSKPVKY
jgi:hypothetical protein